MKRYLEQNTVRPAAISGLTWRAVEQLRLLR